MRYSHQTLTLSDGEAKVCLLPQQLYVSSHCRTTDFNVIIGQRVVSGRNFACAILIRHWTLCPTVKLKSVCFHSNCMFLSHCRTAEPGGASGPLVQVKHAKFYSDLVVAFSSLARMLGESSTVHSPPALFF